MRLFAARTFKAKKHHEKNSNRYNMHRQMKETLHAGNLMAAVKVPKGENPFEWLLSNTIDFYNQINLLYGSIADFCTAETCPVMNAGPNFEYLWADKNIKKPKVVSAPEYAELLMNWIGLILEDRSICPEQFGPKGPPKPFLPAIKQIYKRLLRIYAHMYARHIHKIHQLDIEAHLNTGFKHFYLFVREFGLISDKKEFEALRPIVTCVCEEYGLALGL